MKYVNTYANNTEFTSDKSSRLDTLDDIWAAYVIENNKTTIKLRKPPAIATYNNEYNTGIELFMYTTDIIDSITLKDSSNTNIEVETVPGAAGGGYIRTKHAVPAGVYTAEFVFKTNVDADLTGCFSETCVQSLSKGFFSALQSISNIQGMFSNCRYLQSLPTELFICGGNATNAYMFCLGCLALKSIPEDLFYYFGNNLVNVYDAFYNSGLLKIPDNLFDNNKQIQNFSQCFMDCTALTGNTPKGTDGIELWNRAGTAGYPVSITGTDCFKNCTNLEEYKNYTIPVEWGGINNTNKALIYKSVSGTPMKLINHLDNVNAINTITINDGGRIATMPVNSAPLEYTPITTGEISVTIDFNNSGLTSVKEMFAECNIIEIPSGLFDSCTDLIYADRCFKDCEELTTINWQVFSKCSNLESVEEIFMGCTNLNFDGDPIFFNNKKIYNFRRAFCNSMSDWTGKTPCDSENTGYYLWDLENDPEHPVAMWGTDCFYVVTLETSEVNTDIPTIWGGRKDFENPCFVYVYSVTIEGQIKLVDRCEYIQSIYLYRNGSAVENVFMNTGQSGELYYNTTAEDEEGGYINFLINFKSNVSNVSYCFDGCFDLVSTPALNNDGSALYEWTDITGMFRNCEALEYVNPYTFNLNSSIHAVGGLFEGCTGLQEIPENLFESTTSISTAQNMANGCTTLRKLPSYLFMGSINSNELKNMQACYKNCGQAYGELPVDGVNGVHYWEIGGISGTDCFYGCGYLSNYQEAVDNGWA